jgi:hypothetical protein
MSEPNPIEAFLAEAENIASDVSFAGSEWDFGKEERDRTERRVKIVEDLAEFLRATKT